MLDVSVRWCSRVPFRLAGFIAELAWVVGRLTCEWITRLFARPIAQTVDVQEIVPEAALDETERETRSCVPVAGYLYLMERADGTKKLGYTTNSVAARRSQILSSTGEALKIVATFESEAAWSTEKVLHAVFGDKNVGGEFFNLSPDDIAMIPAIIGMVEPSSIAKRIASPTVIQCSVCGNTVSVEGK